MAKSFKITPTFNFLDWREKISYKNYTPAKVSEIQWVRKNDSLKIHLLDYFNDLKAVFYIINFFLDIFTSNNNTYAIEYCVRAFNRENVSRNHFISQNWNSSRRVFSTLLTAKAAPPKICFETTLTKLWKQLLEQKYLNGLNYA